MPAPIGVFTVRKSKLDVLGFTSRDLRLQSSGRVGPPMQSAQPTKMGRLCPEDGADPPYQTGR
jgi:hypothetical protein